MSNPRERPPTPATMLLLKEPLAIDFGRLVEAILRLHRGACDEVAGMAGEGSNGRSGVLTVAGQRVAVMTLERPFPCDSIAARSVSHWPEVTAACAEQRGHAIVSLMGPPPNQLEGMRIVTAVAGAIADSYPDVVLGGLWDGVVLNSRRDWQSQSTMAFAPYPNLPISLWVSFHPFNAQPGAGIVTQGLTRFVGRELELVDPRMDLLRVVQRAQGLATYLIQNGLVLKDGDTFGASDAEGFRVRLGDSVRFRGLAVIAANLSME